MHFHVGMAELNGWRNSMEDAHLVLTKDDYGIFGVFDGHGGGDCSEFAARRLKEEFEKHGKPEDDATVKRLFLSIDQEFLDSQQASGSTATMCIVQKAGAGGKHKLQVINAGDSRVLLGRRDGTIVDGGGSDMGLTRDHKPEDPIERERIERAGGKVDTAAGGVARVNGNLSVCRGFGDKDAKKGGASGPEDHPVTADPEFGHFECGETDFLLLVCDGVSEGNFPNAEVVKLVADILTKDNDPVAAAKAVCHKAVEMDSKDNITCMVVLLSGSSEPFGTTVDFIPGPILNLGNKDFHKAYSAMAARAGITLIEAAAKRYEFLQQELKADSENDELMQEAEMIGTPEGTAGTEERNAWFEKWLNSLPEEKDSGGMPDMLSQLMARGGGGYADAAEKGDKGSGKGQSRVEVDDDEHDEDGYAWNQKGEEVQVVFKLPTPATKKDVKIDFKVSALSVAVNGSSLLEGSLGGKVETEECTWCLASGGTELQVMLTKKDASQNWKALVM